ncbi:atrial natriuretic peptide receptor 3 [Thrips palmi]|uniref:Atrial natriuretic peptide receptor 3 n=1 Tax=Thrips palmi TaxID=161013 RepID=A0A6P8YBQ2_THRPL|nr:atrial natriuretic peptide receptor 3 [Thrips palmi]
MAAEAMGRQGLWPSDLLSFLPGNDKCDAVYGQISAVDSYAHDCAHVFFGPTCEYSVAPVGRMVKFWNTPLLTVGALTHDFTTHKTSCEDEYHMMTRVGTLSFRDVAQVLVAVMNECVPECLYALHSRPEDRYSWERAMMVYDKDGFKNLSGEHTCKLMMEALVKVLKQLKFQYGAFDTEKASNQGMKEHLRREVGNEFSGEYLTGARRSHILDGVWRKHLRTLEEVVKYYGKVGSASVFIGKPERSS